MVLTGQLTEAALRQFTSLSNTPVITKALQKDTVGIIRQNKLSNKNEIEWPLNTGISEAFGVSKPVV